MNLQYLFILASLLGNELIKHGAVILVDLLHLVDVAGHFFHGFQSLCRRQEHSMLNRDLLLTIYTCVGVLHCSSRFYLSHCVGGGGLYAKICPFNVPMHDGMTTGGANIFY